MEQKKNDNNKERKENSFIAGNLHLNRTRATLALKKRTHTNKHYTTLHKYIYVPSMYTYLLLHINSSLKLLLLV